MTDAYSACGLDIAEAFDSLEALDLGRAGIDRDDREILGLVSSEDSVAVFGAVSGGSYYGKDTRSWRVEKRGH